MNGVRRREFIALLSGAAFALPFAAHAQQPAALTREQSDALNAYNNAVNDFQIILSQRRTQIELEPVTRHPRTSTLPCSH